MVTWKLWAWSKSKRMSYELIAAMEGRPGAEAPQWFPWFIAGLKPCAPTERTCCDSTVVAAVSAPGAHR